MPGVIDDSPYWAAPSIESVETAGDRRGFRRGLEAAAQKIESFIMGNATGVTQIVFNNIYRELAKTIRDIEG